MSSFVNRMIGAAKLDPNLYEEVEANPRVHKAFINNNYPVQRIDKNSFCHLLWKQWWEIV